MGVITLNPAFDPDITAYTATTTNATNTITATPEDASATVEISNGGTTVANGTAATWAEGSNAVTITVTNGAASTVYTVDVEKITQ